MDGREAPEAAPQAKPGRNFEELYGGASPEWVIPGVSYSRARDQPATRKAASTAGMRMQAQRLVWVAMSLMCSPPMRSSATRQARGPKARRASKRDAKTTERVRRRPAF